MVRTVAGKVLELFFSDYVDNWKVSRLNCKLSLQLLFRVRRLAEKVCFELSSKAQICH